MRPSNVYRSLAHARSARAICQRCGANIEHPTLDWQLEQGAFSIINLRILTCRTCQDKIQPQKRQFAQYTDPLTIEFPLPEDYSKTDNPVSPIGFSPRSQTAGANIGTLLQAAGLNAAFDGNVSKTTVRSAVSFTPTAGFTNTIGKDWLPGGGLPLSIFTPLSYSVASFKLYGPTNGTISGASATGVQFQGSSDGVNWTVLYSTTTIGSIAEVLASISSNLTTGNFQQHRFAIQSQGQPIAVAQAQFNVATTGTNEE
jgi:hypothetical protein